MAKRYKPKIDGGSNSMTTETEHHHLTWLALINLCLSASLVILFFVLTASVATGIDLFAAATGLTGSAAVLGACLLGLRNDLAQAKKKAGKG